MGVRLCWMDASMKCTKRSRRTNRWPHPPSKAKCPRPSRILDLPSSSPRRWLSSLFVHSLSHLDLHDDRLGHLDTFLLSYLYLYSSYSPLLPTLWFVGASCPFRLEIPASHRLTNTTGHTHTHRYKESYFGRPDLSF